MPESIDNLQSTGAYVPLNGINMYYELYGAGKPLVLIHGGGSTIQTSFGNIIPLLAPHFKVIAMDLQAHGRTSDRDVPESFEQDADDVAALLRHLQVRNAFVLGFSNGGNTAMQVAIRHPSLVGKLVVVAAFYKRSGLIPGFFEGMENATIDMMPRSLKDAFLKVNPDATKLLNMFNKDRTRMLYFEDWDESVLQSIRIPVLIISGDRDVMLETHTMEMAQHFDHHRLMIVPGMHGECIGTAEAPSANPLSISFTVANIIDFLQKD